MDVYQFSGVRVIFYGGCPIVMDFQNTVRALEFRGYFFFRPMGMTRMSSNTLSPTL